MPYSDKEISFTGGDIKEIFPSRVASLAPELYSSQETRKYNSQCHKDEREFFPDVLESNLSPVGRVK